MSHMRYNRVGSKKHCYSSSSCQGFKGFRLNPRRFSVQRLRSKFLCLMKIFSRWRNSYGNALRSFRRNLARSRSCRKDHGGPNLVLSKEEMYIHNGGSSSSRDHVHIDDCSRLRSFARTNSFYTEAIADCLDFIKRNSLSMEENPVLSQT